MTNHGLVMRENDSGDTVSDDSSDAQATLQAQVCHDWTLTLYFCSNDRYYFSRFLLIVYDFERR